MIVEPESPHPAGIIGFVGQDTARYHAFTSAMCGLRIPQDCSLAPGIGYDTSYNSNACIKAMLSDPKFRWVWIMDDDHTFEQRALLELLDADVDVVVPLYAQRHPPFLPCIYKAEPKPGYFRNFRWQDLDGQRGLLPIVSAGKGGILIRRAVIEAMGQDDEWFERIAGMGEDHYFFTKIRRLGFDPYCHLDVRLGHMTPVMVLPQQNPEGEWCPVVDLGRGVFCEVRAAIEEAPV